ncbi:MAG: hypothetical protein R2728_07705 [Chitinophagales bacterium]
MAVTVVPAPQIITIGITLIGTMDIAIMANVELIMAIKTIIGQTIIIKDTIMVGQIIPNKISIIILGANNSYKGVMSPQQFDGLCKV